MADDASDCSVATSSSAVHNWWNLAPEPHSISLWNDPPNNMNPWNPNSNPNSTSSCEDDISTSFTNASNHSGLSIESHELAESASQMDLSAEPTSENHIWNQVLISVESNGGLQNVQDDEDNLLEAFSSKNLSREMFEPACDYLKKLENCWEITNSVSFNGIEKQLNSYNGSLMEHERLSNLSDLVSNWSLAPPEPDISQFELTTETKMKLELPNSSSYSSSEAAGNANSGYLPCFEIDLKEENIHLKDESQHQDLETSESSFLRAFTGQQMGLTSSITGNNKVYYGISDVPWSSTRNFSDLISFGGCLNKPLMDFPASKPCLKVSNLQDCKKNTQASSSLTKANGKGSGITGEGKKKRSDDNSEILFKKPKHESSAASLKMQVPKVKLGERITALQQLVSPFGKTDTASVLLEAIGYIKFLQEQIHLLSNPYMKSSATRQSDHNLWGGLERKEKSEAKLDLKSRGLCLVPVSSTPQVCRENGGVDYWTPTYRGCLYR